MSSATRVSIYLSDDEKAILDCTANRLGISRSEVFRHLTLYHGLCGGDFPLTSRIMALAPGHRDKITAEIRARAEKQDHAKPQSFRQWIKEALGNDDPETLDRGADTLLRKLLEK